MSEFGTIIRTRRQALGWTLAQLAESAGCSKAYLSGIENGRLNSPPRPPLIERLEKSLDMTSGELRRLAEWEATPPKVRAEMQALIEQLKRTEIRGGRGIRGRRADGAMDLDELYRSGALQAAAGDEASNMEKKPRVCYQVPLINKVAAGYPTDFTDLDYPARAADGYVSCPDVADPDAFATRVVGDSMLPEYREGDIIVFSPAQAPSDGADCFVRLLPDHHTMFKRVYFEGEDRVRLQPLNPKFPAQTVELDEVSGLYPAVFRMQAIGGKGGGL